MLLPVIRFGDLSPWVILSVQGSEPSRQRFLHAIYGPFLTFAPALFHIFFHSCGKLRGETLRERADARGKTDCIPQRTGAAIDTLVTRSLLSMVSPLGRARRRGFQDYEGQTYFPAESPAPQEDARFSRAHVDEERAPGVEASPRQGPEAARRHAFPLVPSHTLPPARRMRRRSEFQRVFDAGRRVHGRHLTVVFASAAGAESRLGIVASRTLGGAVVRNRAKRLIRQLFRTNDRPVPALDLVVIPKASAAGLSAAELGRDYQATLKRLNLSRR